MLNDITDAGRVYDHFLTQGTVGLCEFSDKPMKRPPEEDLYYECFPAKYTTCYLEEYVDQHTFNGQTLRERIRFGVEVDDVSRLGAAEWALTTRERATGIPWTIHTSRVIVASGLSSVPNMPDIPGKERFRGQIIHQEAFGSSDILSSSSVNNITVIGGAKSSADMVYAAVKAGKDVSWVIKASETTGPGFLMMPKGVGPYKNALELAMTRLASTLVPSYLNGGSWFVRLLHGYKYGVKLISWFWATVDSESRKEANYKARPNVGGFEKLEPHTQ